jgi:hypothetical protein
MIADTGDNFIDITESDETFLLRCKKDIEVKNREQSKRYGKSSKRYGKFSKIIIIIIIYNH